MAENKGMTRKMALEAAIEVVKNGADVANAAEIVEVLEKMRASLEKRNTAEQKPKVKTPEQKELEAAILDNMEMNKKYTAREIADAIGVTTQKLIARFKALEEADEVVSFEGEKKRDPKLYMRTIASAEVFAEEMNSVEAESVEEAEEAAADEDEIAF